MKNLPTTGGTLTGALNGTSASFSGNVAAGTAVAQSTNSILSAAQFSGSDCGAKINAADSQLGATGGEIDVSQACGALGNCK